MHSLHLGDCLEILPTIPSGSIDAVIADPPWMNYTTGRYDAREWHRPIKELAPSHYMPELYRVLKDDRAIIVWCRWDSFGDYAAAALAAGFTVKNCIVWAKPNHTAGDLDGNLGNKHEMALFAVKGRWKRHDKREVNLWQESHLFTRAHRDHPTQKPIDLMRRAVRTIADVGDVVLDCFMGSGSTGVAALMEGRSFVGIELDAGYFAIAQRRLENVQPALMEVA
jgi:site-specific DNA-methyltransferase (adenine-specific)